MRPQIARRDDDLRILDAGIRDQKRRLHDLLVSGVVVFEDINLRPDALYQFGAQLEDIRKKLHAIDANGHRERSTW